MAEAKIAALFGHPTRPMPTHPILVVPTQVILCEVDFAVRGRKLVFHYSRTGTFNIGDDHDFSDIESAAKAIIRLDWRPDDWKIAKLKPRRSSLSLNNRDFAYLMFLLNDDRDWRFSRETTCFSLFDDKNIDLSKYYINPMCVDMNGDPIGEGTGGEKSILAYFIARGDAANRDQHGNNVDRFNLHVDFDENDDAENPQYCPVMIDPDVGYPEGTDP